ncbi:MAG: hypothetical protein WBJ21_14350, partial [Burkholderiaceae bacterium]
RIHIPACHYAAIDQTIQIAGAAIDNGPCIVTVAGKIFTNIIKGAKDAVFPRATDMQDLKFNRRTGSETIGSQIGC